MAKRAQRRPVRYEKDQSGCMWGLISIFDFRQGRTTRRLLSDKKRGSRHLVGYSKNKFETLTDLDENHQVTIDGKESTEVIVTDDTSKPSMKKLIEEEMVSEQEPKKEISNVEVERKPCNSGHEVKTKAEQKKTKKTRKKSHDMDNHDLNAAKNLESECSCNQKSEKQSISNVGIDEIMEEFYHSIHQKSLSSVKHDQDGKVQVQSNQKHSDFEKLSEAIKEFINQNFISGNHIAENEKIHNSKELMGALEILSSDEELFLKLIQDPNSLLAKYVLNLQDAQENKSEESKSLATESNLSEQGLGSFRQSEELVSRKQQRNFFRRKVKSQERNSLNQNENSEASTRIVILKPGPTGLQNSETESSLGSSAEPHYTVEDKGLNERVGSHYFLAEIKRKLKSAMGKERHGIPSIAMSNRFRYERQNLGDSDTAVGKENVGRNSPNKDHFYIERIARPSTSVKKGDKTSKLKGSETSTEHEIDGHPKQRVSNIYVEAKKHLSEMLSNGEEGVDFASKQVPKSLGRILSLPEYNLSPIGSPGRDWEDNFVTAQMRLSAYGKIQNVNSNTGSPKRENNVSHLGRATQNIESQSCISDSLDNKVQPLNSNSDISDDLIHDDGEKETFASVGDEMSPEGVIEIVKETEIVVEEEISVLNAPSEPSSSSVTKDDQNADMSEICDDKGYSESLKQDSYEENQVPSSPLESPSSSSISKKVENLERAIDIAERPSPVSVLESLFTEDDMSPTNCIAQPVEPPVKPLQIQFEEHDSSAANQVNCAKTCMEDKEFIFDYVKAVLQASGLNWDEFCVKCLSSDQLLDPSLFDEVEFFANQLCYNRKLLFDCIDEVLLEACRQHFGCCPWVSFVRPSIRPVPNMKIAIREVWEGVYWHLLPLPLPRTLDQILRKEMSRTGTWMDLRFDADTIGVEMGEVILEELMEDTIFSCVNESPHGEYTAMPAELEENKSSMDL